MREETRGRAEGEAGEEAVRAGAAGRSEKTGHRRGAKSDPGRGNGEGKDPDPQYLRDRDKGQRTGTSGGSKISTAGKGGVEPRLRMGCRVQVGGDMVWTLW